MKTQVSGWDRDFWPRNQKRRWPEESHAALASGGLRGPCLPSKGGENCLDLARHLGLEQRSAQHRQALEERIRHESRGTGSCFLTSSLQSRETETQSLWSLGRQPVSGSSKLAATSVTEGELNAGWPSEEVDDHSSLPGDTQNGWGKQ